jgi:hypothetical protein
MEQLQRTEAWHKVRNYKFTSSRVHALLTEPRSREAKERGELGETAKTYILEKITQEINGFIPEFSSKETQWGIEQEDNAKMWYHINTGNAIGDVMFCEYNDFYGGSPDSAVIDTSLSVSGEEGVINGALEIKCPYNSINHLKHCLIKSAEHFKAKHPEYYWQCISHMITLKVGFCDFVSFDPRIDHEIGFSRFRLERNEEDEKLLLSKLNAANEYKAQLKIQLGLL